ncbi:MAG TPA: hypothetical protein VMZ06_17985 [Candidatus Bathyarchaeia archaeon]|nr:hypothetical protein [Candidatus Bathyarchaeia archaeon]
MKTILDRMRLERRITLIILAVLMAVGFVYFLFFRSGGSTTTYTEPVAGSAPAEWVEQ